MLVAFGDESLRLNDGLFKVLRPDVEAGEFNFVGDRCEPLETFCRFRGQIDFVNGAGEEFVRSSRQRVDAEFNFEILANDLYYLIETTGRIGFCCTLAF